MFVTDAGAQAFRGARLRPGAVLIAVALLGAACASTSPSSTGTVSVPVAAGSPTITVEKFQFTKLTVPAGTRVSVVNEDSVPHQLYSTAFSTVQIGQGKTTTFTAPSTPGVYEYSDAVDTYMTGYLTVTPS